MINAARPGRVGPVEIVAAGAILVVLVVHFSITVLVNLPVNAISLQLRTALVSYESLLFVQGWSMFAPDPIDQDLEIEARFSGASRHITQWYSLTKAYRSPVKAARISQYDITDALLGMAAIELEERAARKDVAKPTLPATDARLMAYRTASAFAINAMLPADLRWVQIRLTRHVFPRFTHREYLDQEPTGVIATYAWQALPNITVQ